MSATTAAASVLFFHNLCSHEGIFTTTYIVKDKDVIKSLTDLATKYEGVEIHERQYREFISADVEKNFMNVAKLNTFEKSAPERTQVIDNLGLMVHTIIVIYVKDCKWDCCDECFPALDYPYIINLSATEGTTYDNLHDKLFDMLDTNAIDFGVYDLIDAEVMQGLGDVRLPTELYVLVEKVGNEEQIHTISSSEELSDYVSKNVKVV